MIETTIYDKSAYAARGEWDNEPDIIAFTDEPTGYECEAIRVKNLGTWCGYVYIPLDHPILHDYCKCCNKYHKIDELDVHGGVTYSRLESNEAFGIGFDCAHSFDFAPSYLSMFNNSMFIQGATYKNKEYVLNEISSLAKQLKEMEHAL